MFNPKYKIHFWKYEKRYQDNIVIEKAFIILPVTVLQTQLWNFGSSFDLWETQWMLKLMSVFRKRPREGWGGEVTGMVEGIWMSNGWDRWNKTLLARKARSKPPTRVYRGPPKYYYLMLIFSMVIQHPGQVKEDILSNTVTFRYLFWKSKFESS